MGSSTLGRGPDEGLLQNAVASRRDDALSTREHLFRDAATEARRRSGHEPDLALRGLRVLDGLHGDQATVAGPCGKSIESGCAFAPKLQALVDFLKVRRPSRSNELR
jgi:hypothetical protein